MFGLRKLLRLPRSKSRGEHRYYLLPGMGRSNRRRHQQMIRWAWAVGITGAILAACLVYFLDR